MRCESARGVPMSHFRVTDTGREPRGHSVARIRNRRGYGFFSRGCCTTKSACEESNNESAHGRMVIGKGRKSIPRLAAFASVPRTCSLKFHCYERVQFRTQVRPETHHTRHMRDAGALLASRLAQSAVACRDLARDPAPPSLIRRAPTSHRAFLRSVAYRAPHQLLCSRGGHVAAEA